MKPARNHRPPTLASGPLTVCPVSLVVLWFAVASAAAAPADLVLRGGTIATMDDSRPLAEALAIRGDRIAAVGGLDEINQLVSQHTRVIELNGAFAAPGFIESHGHFVELGRSKMILDLSEAKSWEEIVQMVKRAAQTTPVGQWIVGRGWHQGKWDRPPTPNVTGYPTHRQLSLATPQHPVLLTHGTGHMCLANALAMKLAGVDRDTKDMDGGEILKDGSGEPIGAFRERAAGLIDRAYARSQQGRSAADDRNDLLTAIRLASRECLKFGVTTFHDAGASFAQIDVFRELAQGGELPVRLWVMVSEGNEALARRLGSYRMIGAGDHHLTVRAVKRLLDGALGTHGAWLLAPYEDLPESTGLNTLSLLSLRRTAELALQHDCQLCVHAIGDRANRETLDLFEATFRAAGGRTDLRWRVEHAQHLHPDDIARFRPLGVIASMQGVHCTSDAPFVVQRLGARRAEEGAYAWRRLLDASAVVANGTDTPVERVDPIACFYSSVTRKLRGGEAFFPAQRMTREEALRSYTRSAAYAGFEEELKGALAPGKLADVVVISRDLLSAPEDQLRAAEVLYTIVGGRVLYDRRGSAPHGEQP